MFAFTAARTVEREPGRPGMAVQVADLRRRGIEDEPVRLHHDPGTHPGSSPVATATASAARRDADRRPYKRAHNEVRTSVTSPTKSSAVSALSRTTMRRPAQAREAFRCAKPNPVNPSRCSTTMTLAAGADNTPGK